MAERRGRWYTRLKWQVHESTSRGGCKLAFCLFGLLPLLVCLALSILPFIPSYQRLRASWWEECLSSQLGVHVAVAAFEARTPERFALHGIRLTHPETGASIGRVRVVEVERLGRQWSIQLIQPELEARQLTAAWQVVHDWFLCRPQRYAYAAQIGMDDLTIHQAERDSSLADISIRMLPSKEAMLVHLGFTLAELDGDSATSLNLGKSRTSTVSPAQLIVKRIHGRDDPRTELQLRTGATPLPCSLVSGLLPQLDRLGSHATFAGVLNVDLIGPQWQAQIINGSFANLDVAQLTLGTQASLGGSGELLLEMAALTPQRLAYARGTAVVHAGQMSRGLFEAAREYLGVAVRSTNPLTTYGFDELQLAFDIAPGRLHLAAAMLDAQGVLAARDPRHWHEPLPLDLVVTALAACDRSLATQNQLAALSSSWLSKRALVWLPLAEEQTQTAARNLRLSIVE